MQRSVDSDVHWSSVWRSWDVFGALEGWYDMAACVAVVDDCSTRGDLVDEGQRSLAAAAVDLVFDCFETPEGRIEMGKR